MDERVFVVVDLTCGVLCGVNFSVYKDGLEYIKDKCPSRWDNQVLICATKDELDVVKNSDIGESETDIFGKMEDIVVGIPDCEHGYGNAYREDVERNKKKFGL